MSKHTPGPWGNRKVFKLTAVTEAPTDPKAHEANARLIAAAPDMLKALRECITDEASVAYKNNDPEKLRRRLRYITKIAIQQIARATGE